MIILKTKNEIAGIKQACRISALALKAGVDAVRPGVTTWDINRAVHDCITKNNAKPAFLGYGGFPAAACISVNEEVIHGIPSKHKVINEGDIVSIDVGAIYNGYYGDNAYTVGAGEISEELKQLLLVTEKSLYLGIEAAQCGNRLGDIGNAVQSYCESFGYGVIRDFVGHGCGKKLHEDPQVPNYGTKGRGGRLTRGMTIAIEPMISLKGSSVYQKADGWTVITESGKPSAHFEHTIAITDNGPVILTQI